VLRCYLYDTTPGHLVVGIVLKEWLPQPDSTPRLYQVASELFWYDHREWKRVTGDAFPDAYPEMLAAPGSNLAETPTAAFMHSDVTRLLLPAAVALQLPQAQGKVQPAAGNGLGYCQRILAYDATSGGFPVWQAGETRCAPLPE
jgi:hypothetical protein